MSTSALPRDRAPEAPASAAPVSAAPVISPLQRILALLELRPARVAAAAAAATTTLAAAFALAAVSGWLITTAWTRPPVLDLTVAVVCVRALGVSRGVFRWVDRMLTHDVALRGVVALRTNLFTALARRHDDGLSRLRRGDLLTRIGDDAQEMGDAVIRAIVPGIVAVAMAVIVQATIAPMSLAATACMLLALVLAGIIAPLAAHRAARISQTAVLGTRALVAADALEILDDASALRVSGALEDRLATLRADQSAHDRSIDRAAVPSAIAAAAVPLVMVLALLGSVLAAGSAWLAGGASAGQIGVLLLLPLSSFEAVTALPAAAAQLARSRAAAERLDAAIGPETAPDPQGAAAAPADRDGALAAATDSAPLSTSAEESTPATDARAHVEDHPGSAVPALTAHALTAGWSASSPRVRDLDLVLAPGERLAVVGPSGCGKSTLLLTLAGLLEPLGGEVRLQGQDISALPADAVRAQLVMFAEDAHVFSTTLRENLRVVRGDLTDAQIQDALEAVGLGDWARRLPQGLATMLGPDGTTISGGERRRLLLARAVLRGAPVTLLDEPTEHLDSRRGDGLLRRLLDPQDDSLLGRGTSAIIVTHRTGAIPPGTRVLRLDATGGHAWERMPR